MNQAAPSNQIHYFSDSRKSSSGTESSLQDVDALPFVSVIVPVYRDWDRLKVCVEALQQQTYPFQLYEVIIVVNGDVIPNWWNRLNKKVILINEEIPGSYNARNRGIQVSQGEILCFTDSDCIPCADWIENGVKTLLENPHLGAVGGTVQLYFKNPMHKTPVELYELVHAFPQEKYIYERFFSATANLFAWKWTFDSIGCFNGSLKSGGDTDWGSRLHVNGVSMGYCGSAIVKHPARHSIQELLKKVVRLTGGIYDACDYSGVLGRKAYIHKLFLFSIPPIKRIFKLFLEKDSVLSFSEKFRYVFVLLAVHYTRLIEFIRLGLGAKSTR